MDPLESKKEAEIAGILAELKALHNELIAFRIETAGTLATITERERASRARLDVVERDLKKALWLGITTSISLGVGIIIAIVKGAITL
jgi:hypothetical protein